MCTVNLQEMSGFTGTGQYYRSSAFSKVLQHTDGVQYLVDNGAAWLVDAVVSHIVTNPKLRNQDLLVAKLIVNGSSALLQFEDGNYHFLAKQDIPYTDFPMPGITLWIQNNVIFLPSEY